MEHGQFSDDFPNKTSIYNGFSIATLNYQRVITSEILRKQFLELLHEFYFGIS